MSDKHLIKTRKTNTKLSFKKIKSNKEKIFLLIFFVDYISYFIELTNQCKKLSRKREKMSSKRKQDFDDHYINVQHVGSLKNK